MDGAGCLRQHINQDIPVMNSHTEKARIVGFTGAGISQESGILPFQ